MSGAWIIVTFAVLMFLAIVYGFYTRRGSAINQRPMTPTVKAAHPARPGAHGSHLLRTRRRAYPTPTAPNDPGSWHRPSRALSAREEEQLFDHYCFSPAA